MLRIGTEAPDFEVKLNTRNVFRLRDQHGKNNVVLFFYPKDFTWGCTREVCAFSQHLDQISPFDATILGISADTPERHDQFVRQYHLRFPLGADTDRSVSRLYDVLRFGFRTLRLTYVIDKQAIIRGIAHHEVVMDNHWKSVVRILKTLDQP